MRGELGIIAGDDPEECGAHIVGRARITAEDGADGLEGARLGGDGGAGGFQEGEEGDEVTGAAGRIVIESVPGLLEI